MENLLFTKKRRKEKFFPHIESKKWNKNGINRKICRFPLWYFLLSVWKFCWLCFLSFPFLEKKKLAVFPHSVRTKLFFTRFLCNFIFHFCGYVATKCARYEGKTSSCISREYFKKKKISFIAINSSQLWYAI